MAELPPGARAVLIDNPNLHSSGRRIIAERLVSTHHQGFLNMMARLEGIFAEGHVVFFPDRVAGQWYVLLDLLDICVFDFNEDNAKEIRSGQAGYEINLKKIHETAAELAKLLKIEEMKSQKNGISAAFAKDSGELLVSAAENSCGIDKACRFDWEVKPKLEPIIGCYDTKYWPTIAELVSELSRQTANVSIIRHMKIPTQIHKKNLFLKKFAELCARSISIKQMTGEIGELIHSDWCLLFNAATNRDDFGEQDIKNHFAGI